jgi:hypothetical protein
MQVVCHKFITFCLRPIEYRFTSLNRHLPIVGIKSEYIGSRCSVKILVYEHWLVVGCVLSYIDGPPVVCIVSVEIFGRTLEVCHPRSVVPRVGMINTVNNTNKISNRCY